MKSGLEIHKQIFINHMTEYYAVVKATKTRYYKSKIVDADQNFHFEMRVASRVRRIVYLY